MATKKCKGCDNPYEKQPNHPPFRNWCSIDCAVTISRAAQERTRERQQAKAKREQMVNTKAARVKHRADKERVKPLSKLLSETQAVINRYVRLRDAHLGCVSCDKPASWGGQWHASHFHARGKSSRLRFSLWNIHKSCSVCNSHLSGNLREYEPVLISRIGQEKFDWMIGVSGKQTRYGADYLRRMKRVFSKRCRIIEARLRETEQ
jgi:hypothetical protein